jgi:hypothetical protein
MLTPKTGNNPSVITSRVLPWMAALVAALALSLVPAASAAPRITSSQRPLISDNITPVFTVPGVHPIGARIRGNHMYVTGPEGLTIFDISDPEHPLPTGALPLPHFENEDVDLGGDTLLISNDPSEGVGILYVIDISDPSMPSLVSATPNGYVDFCQGCFGIGAEEAVPPGVGHTASCIPGPQGACQYAYLAGTGQGIAIVDLTDRTKPFVAKTFKPDITGAATHDVQIDGAGLAWIVGYEGSEAYDISDPLNPRPVMRTDPNVKNTGVAQPGVIPPSANPLPGGTVTEPITGIPLVGGDGASPIDFIHHDSLRFDAPEPAPAAGVPAPPATDGNPSTVDSSAGADAPRATDQSGVQGERQTSPPAKPKPKAKKRVVCNRYRSKAKRRRCYAKRRKAKAKAKRISRAATATATRASATPAHASASSTASAAASRTYPAGGTGDIVGIVEEDYARPTCEGAGSFQTWKIDDDGVLRLQDMWGTEIEALPQGSGFAPVTGLCSAHYFDQRDGLVANAWYEEGTRFLDVSDPKHIKQIGYWIPAKGETWSALFAPNDPTGQTVYALDFVRGIEVLHVDRGAGMKARKAPVRRSWLRKKRAASASRVSLTGWSKQGRYGYVCRIATAKAVRAARR